MYREWIDDDEGAVFAVRERGSLQDGFIRQSGGLLRNKSLFAFIRKRARFT